MKNKIKKFEPNWDSLDSRVIPDWFQKAKFGIFIHWGVYSVPAWRKVNNALFGSYAEWYYASVYSDYNNNDDDFHSRIYGKDFLYRDFAKSFHAELFSAEQWAALFKEAGAKYVVLTSKHHEGYCMWPTKNKHKKNWRVGDVGPKQDILGSLTQAVRNQNMKMGVYYSMVDWETNWSHRPKSGYFVPERDRKLFGISEQKYPDEILIPQLKELVELYQPSLIFSDGGEWDLSEEYSQAKEFLAWLYNNAPNKDEVVVNDRFCVDMPGNHGDYYSTEYNDKEGFGKIHPWEESRGIGKSYGFNRAEQLCDYRTSEQLIHQMIEIVSKGGNFLLNVGPTSDGRIPLLQQERLIDIGKWMAINGEAIYDTTFTHRIKNPSVSHQFITEKENVNYLMMTSWPTDNIQLKLNEVVNVKDCLLLTHNGEIPITFNVQNDTIIIDPVPLSLKENLLFAYTIKIVF